MPKITSILSQITELSRNENIITFENNIILDLTTNSAFILNKKTNKKKYFRSIFWIKGNTLIEKKCDSTNKIMPYSIFLKTIKNSKKNRHYIVSGNNLIHSF